MKWDNLYCGYNNGNPGWHVDMHQLYIETIFIKKAKALLVFKNVNK